MLPWVLAGDSVSCRGPCAVGIGGTVSLSSGRLCRGVGALGLHPGLSVFARDDYQRPSPEADFQREWLVLCILVNIFIALQTISLNVRITLCVQLG